MDMITDQSLTSALFESNKDFDITLMDDFASGYTITEKETTDDENHTKKKESSLNYQEQIEALMNEIKRNQEQHEKMVREHQQVLAQKEQMIKQKKQLIEQMKKSHQEKILHLTRTQQQTISRCQAQHELEFARLEKQLQRQQTEAKGSAIEKLLNDFEQEQHTLRGDASELSSPSSPSPSHILPTSSQEDYLSASTLKNTPYISPLYVPTRAVSWPSPPPLSSLKRSSTIYLQQEQ